MYVIIRGMSGKLGVGILALAAFCASVRGEVISPPPLPGSAYADTEVATNIPFNSEHNDETDGHGKWRRYWSLA